MMVESSWARERAVLEVLAEADEAGEGFLTLGPREIAEATGYDVAKVRRSLERLHDAGYIDASITMAGGNLAAGFRVTGMSERGYRESGLWPSVELDFAQLVGIVEELAGEAPPDEQTRWRRIAEGIAGAGRDVAVQFLAALARHEAGL